MPHKHKTTQFMVYHSDMARPTTTEQQGFGVLLADLRKSKGLTQIQLAERLNTSQQMVDYYERRAANPTAKTIQKISEALDVSISDLAVQKDDKKNKPGPKSKLEKLTDRLSSLPKSKQKVVVDMLEGFLEKTS